MPEITAQKTGMRSVQWKIAGSLPAPGGQPVALGVAGPVAGVHNDVLIVAGGANFPGGMPWKGGKKKYYSDAFVFKRVGDSVMPYKTFQFPFAIAYAATCTLPEGVLAVGGENEDGITGKVFLVRWNDTSETLSIKDLPPLPFAVTNASVAVHDNKIYVAGGERAEDVSADFLVLDLDRISSGWENLPPLPVPVSHAPLVVQSNGNEAGIYLVGGRKRNPGRTSDLYASVWQYNLRTNQWSAQRPLPYALSAGTGMAAGDDGILLFGGDAGETFHRTESLIAAINQETRERKKVKLNEEKMSVQSTHPGFCRQVFLYNTKNDQWQELGCIPFEVAVTTTAVPWNGAIWIPSGEIRAGVRTPHILIGRLFSAGGNELPLPAPYNPAP